MSTDNVVLRQENGALRAQNTVLNRALQDTIRQKEVLRKIAHDHATIPNDKFLSLQGFFVKIEAFIHDKVSCEFGEYRLDSDSIKKLLEMFPPEVM